MAFASSAIEALCSKQRRFFTTVAYVRNKLQGIDVLREPKINKGLGFTFSEREQLKLKGLLPPSFRSQEEQEAAVMKGIRNIRDGLLKYVYLKDLQCTNERLFYRVLCNNTEELMPIVYTPVVGEACLKYSYIYTKPRGLYITAEDAGHVSSILDNWPEKDVRAICVTDGGRILGLGDLGANGMGIPIGKLCLYTALAGIPPSTTLPITIDVGTNNELLLSDPLYTGLRQKRLTGPKYDELLDEFMEAVVKKWGKSCLIQFEDFNNANAFRLLKKYQNKYCTFNDDIQGTAAVCVAGLIASCGLTKTKIRDNVFLFFGAGGAALGIADLLVKAMVEDGLTRIEARSQIWLMDAYGLLSTSRTDLDEQKMRFVKDVKHTSDLEEIINMAKPTALIGASAQGGAFTESILKTMASLNERPIIFPLSNPTSKAECTAKDAYLHTDGRCVFASGSPFDPFSFGGRTFHPSQGNNAYIFPGVALGIIACRVHHIPDFTFLVAAKSLANLVTDEYLEEQRLYPPLHCIRDVSLSIAAKVADYFYSESLATVKPEPTNMFDFVKQNQYDWRYD
ncbi:NADP-dependent malic enzyme-like isoform X1 [Dinothrombium tinctorium]|uniref:Malic enzyme n=1 Tax=Dinothrombium tinctorium TaxID=1965070 RepID=A0A3S3SRC0_9ACAR|nr:NADP-dependent malic enzyme-like isoform X1 [Dinothrombium tinctorium]